MSEPHTADLGTRYRYRQEGAEAERERIIKLLEGYSDGELLVIPTGQISKLIKGETE